MAYYVLPAKTPTFASRGHVIGPIDDREHADELKMHRVMMGEPAVTVWLDHTPTVEQVANMKGIRARVYTADATYSAFNSVIASTWREVTIAGPGLAPHMRHHFPTVWQPPVILGEAGGRVHVRPLTAPEQGYHGYMFGGAFVHSPQPEFAELFGHRQPVHLHDYQERAGS